MEALENTNRMRFLRNRYVDPFTGKDDWRLLHAGPGGIILDSKVKNNRSAQVAWLAPEFLARPATPPTSPLPAQFLWHSLWQFVVWQFGWICRFAKRQRSIQHWRQLPNGQAGRRHSSSVRPPAMSASGARAFCGRQSAAGPYRLDDRCTCPGYTGDAGFYRQAGSSFPIQVRARRNGTLAGRSQRSGNRADGTAQDPQAMLQAMLQNQNNPQQAVQAPSGFGNTGTAATARMADRTITRRLPRQPILKIPGKTLRRWAKWATAKRAEASRGVASKSPGHTIKIVKEQTDRSLWEFVYDMQPKRTPTLPVWEMQMVLPLMEL